MKTSSAKAKGRNLQKFVVAAILQLFPSLEPDDVRSTSMGASGVDIQLSPAARKLLPVAIECKNQESISIWASWKQAMSNAGKYKPVLVFKRNNQDPLVCISFDYYLELVKGKLNEY